MHIEYDFAKNPSYFQGVRTEILPLIEKPLGRVLEIGCGGGGTLNWLKTENLCDYAVGVEVSEAAAAAARERVDEVHCLNLDVDELPFEPGAFDAILALDVLEHLVDPWDAVERLSALLSTGGVVIASIPNVRHYQVMLDLIFKGEFEYDPKGGILDLTHLRFFTRSSAIALLESGGLSVDQVETTGRVRTFSMKGLLVGLSAGWLRDFYVYQYLIRGRRVDAS